MTYEDINHKIKMLEVEIENSNKLMEIFQSNINSNITWFLACVAIIITLLGVVGVAIYFIVQQAINKGVKSGIKIGIGDVEDRIKNYLNENLQFIHAKGKSNIKISNEKYFIDLPSFDYLTKENFISLSIVNKNGKIINYSECIIDVDSIIIYFNNSDLEPEDTFVYWNLVYKNDKFFTGIEIISF